MFEFAIILGLVLMVLQVSDIATTLYALSHGLREKNPLAILAFRLIGVKTTMLVKFCIVLAITVLMVFNQAVGPLMALVVLYAFITGWNVGKIVLKRRII